VAWITERAGGIELNLRVLPGARKDRVDGVHGEALKVRLQAPPVEGKANRALVDFLADALRVSRSRIRILSGEKGRNKRVFIEGASATLCRHLADGAQKPS
jgi:hypothetical protein